MRGSADVAEVLRQNEALRQQQRAVGEVMRAVASHRGLQPVLDEIVEAANRLCDGDHAQLYLAEGQAFRIVAQTSDLAETYYEFHEERPHPRDRTTIVGRVALSGQTVQIPDAVADPEYTFPAQEIIGYRALLGVPIDLEANLIGVIAVARDSIGTFSDEHVQLVETFAAQAAIALANARLLGAVERQRRELSRFVSRQVADLITTERGEELLAGHRAYITCFFCDLRGFTSFAEMAAPEELFDVLRAYHEMLGDLIQTFEGTLEHFAGDGVMVFFNDPVERDDHELQAIRLALAAQERFRELARLWKRRGIDLGLGIGIEAGYATLGRIGFEGRYDYGALGPVTNLASRLSTHADPGQTLVGQRVFAAIEESVDALEVGDLELKGFGRPITAYEVVSLRDTASPTA